MDSNLKDESRDRRREEVLVRRLGEALDQVAPRGTEPCPDAELIAAYHEQALQPDEAAQCETHFAGCARCRKILAVLAASADTPLAEKEVARLGELVAGARVQGEAESQTSKPVRPNLLDWRARWLAPALGVAAILAVWLAIRPPWRATDQGSSGTLVAQAPKNESSPAREAPSGQSLRSEPTKGLGADSATPSAALSITPNDQPANKTALPKPSAEALAKNSVGERRAADALAPNAGIAGGASGNEKKEQAELNTALAGAPSPAAPRTAAPMHSALAQAQSEAAGLAAPSPPEAPASTSQSVTVTGEAPPVSSTTSSIGGPVNDKKAAELPMNGRNYRDLAVLNATAGNAFLIKAPSGSNVWRAGKGGGIERSTDAGQTWRVQASPVQDDWLAGAAVSDTICWIVGRNGAIARTTDGEHWERVVSPAQAAASGKLPDWVGIAASDARTATITASDGRRYATQDGGKTWHPVPNN